VSAVNICMSHPEVVQAEASIIPGPPPHYENALVVNVSTRWKFEMLSATDTLRRSRMLCCELLDKFSDDGLLTVAKTAISIVDCQDEALIRIYSVTLRSVDATRVSTEADLSELSLNEFSMLEDVRKRIEEESGQLGAIKSVTPL